MSRARLAVLAALVALAAAATACDESPPASQADDPGLAHVHGLGINPADGELYVATHFGVFVVREGEAERMGTLVQDTMGFTVAGPDRFLGSGHPDVGHDPILDVGMPPLLGLIESTDRGVTWEGLSLQGEADFHALAFVHNRVYGFDVTGERFMVSSDGVIWDIRSAAQLLSFAVAPDDPDRVVATTYEAEVVTSGDGGRSWEPMPGTPQLAFLSWDEQAGLWSLGPDGSVHVSTDGGASWESPGSVGGRPAALLAHPDALYAATADAITTSTDGGVTWAVLYEIE